MPFLKPDSCKPCPFYTLSKYITPDTIVNGSTEAILAQAPGKHEEDGIAVEGYDYIGGKRIERTVKVQPQPLIGTTGNWLRREFMPLTGLNYTKMTKANALKCRPYGSNEIPSIGSNKPVHGITVTQLKEAVAFCTRTHLHLPHTVTTILAMGEVSLYALTGEELLKYKKDSESEHGNSTISEWRGWCLGVDLVEKTILGLHEYYDCSLAGSARYPHMVNVFPVIHIAALFQNARLYHATLLDFTRFGKLVRKEWPEPLPEIKINVIPESIPSTIGFDTEYIEDSSRYKELTMWSMADVQRNIYVVDAAYSKQLSNLPDRLTVITQNGLVDLPNFLPLLPDDFDRCRILIQDCMLAHALQWTGELNSLDYQLSKVGSYNRHKHLRESYDLNTKYLYAGLDADSTLNATWKALVKGFSLDKAVWNEYILRRQPLLSIIDRSQQKGIAVYQERVAYVEALLQQRIAAIQEEAKLLTGNPNFNIRSNHQIKAALYEGIYDIEKPKPVKSVKQKKKKEKPASVDLKAQIKQLVQTQDEEEIVKLFLAMGKK